LKAVIIDAFNAHEGKDITGLLNELLAEKGWETRLFPISEMDIRPCSSCGNCAAKTPGRCSITDDMEQIYQAWSQCRLLIFCTPLSFGGYSSRLKLVQDRFMPMNTALFTIRKGELHHENRYWPTPSLLTVGQLNNSQPGEKEAFEYLTERNAINMNIDKWAAVVLPEEDPAGTDLRHRLDQAIKEVI